MKIYTIGREENKCYGHGDYNRETSIVPLGFYGSGGMPPCFTDRNKAADLATKNPGYVVVALELVE